MRQTKKSVTIMMIMIYLIICKVIRKMFKKEKITYEELFKIRSSNNSEVTHNPGSRICLEKLSFGIIRYQYGW